MPFPLTIRRRLLPVVLVTLSLLVAAPARTEPLQIVTEEFPPYNFTQEGRVTGMSTDVVQAVCKQVHLDAHIQVYPWARAYEIALNEKNTLIFSIGKSPEREKLFQWAGSIAPVQSCLFALKTRPDIEVGTLEEARNYYIITQLQGRTAQILQEHGFRQWQNLFLITSVDRAFLMLQTGRGDLVGYPELVMHYTVRKNGLEPASTIRKVYCFKKVSHLYAAFSRQTPGTLVTRFQTGLKIIKENGTYLRILQRYLN